MNPSAFAILYVESLPRSVEFYSRLLEKPALEQSENFALFAVNSGLMLGLWSRREVLPAVSAHPGACEIAFEVGDQATVENLHREWLSRGLLIAQSPTVMDFGHTFVALDDDGHRLRVFAPSHAFDANFRP